MERNLRQMENINNTLVSNRTDDIQENNSQIINKEFNSYVKIENDIEEEEFEVIDNRKVVPFFDCFDTDKLAEKKGKDMLNIP